MAVPKRRTSKSRRDKRRTHKKLIAVNALSCPNCGQPVLSHRVCRHCGHYNGKEIIEVEE